jgi:Zn-dependent metalloprotease
MVGSIAVAIVGHTPADDCLKFAHTWGPGWGDVGFGTMDKDAAREMFQGEQMWAVEAVKQTAFEWETAPATTPAPPARARPHRKKPAGKPVPRREPVSRPRAGGLQRFVYDATGTYDAKELALLRAERDAATGDPAADEAYDAMGYFYDFFKKVHGRDSYDGAGAPLEAVVHYGREFSNGFWDGKRVVLGDGDGHLFNRFSASPDVVTHELTLGLVLSEVSLKPQGQQGSLMQSLGDVFTSMVKQYRLGQTVEEANWLIGDGLMKETVNGKALFSLAEPGTAYDDEKLGKDQQVRHLSDFVVTVQDQGGIRVNAGILNHAFYRVAMLMGGKAWERASRIWYEALLNFSPKGNTVFRGFALQTVRAAKGLFGAKSDEVAKVIEGWGQVGISVSARTGAGGRRGAAKRQAPKPVR